MSTDSRFDLWHTRQLAILRADSEITAANHTTKHNAPEAGRMPTYSELVDMLKALQAAGGGTLDGLPSEFRVPAERITLALHALKFPGVVA